MSSSKLKTFKIAIAANGALRMIYNDEHADFLREAGEAVTTRASHVEPSGNGWTADMSPVDGPVLGPFPLREQALQAETEYLDSILF